MIKRVLIFFCFFFISASYAAVASSAGATDYQNLVTEDLLAMRDFEVENLTPNEVKKLNIETLNRIRQLPKSGSKKNSYITRDMAESMVQSIIDHPVVGDHVQHKYEQTAANIGYCFGRATYVHWLAKNLGLNKDSVKKVWVVGPMKESEDKLWGFHVATAIRGEDHIWWVIDNNTEGLKTLDEWNKFWQKTSQDGKLRLYITDPEKFSAPIGKYSHIELGTNLKRKNDWYKGYFKDLLKWFQSAPDFEELGLPPARHVLSCRKLLSK